MLGAWPHLRAFSGQQEPKGGRSQASSGRSVTCTDTLAHELLRMIPLASHGPARPPAPSSAVWRRVGHHCLCDPGETHTRVKRAPVNSLEAAVYTFLKIKNRLQKTEKAGIHSLSPLILFLTLLLKTYLLEPCVGLRVHVLSPTSPCSAPTRWQALLRGRGLRPGKHRRTQPR